MACPYRTDLIPLGGFTPPAHVCCTWPPATLRDNEHTLRELRAHSSSRRTDNKSQLHQELWTPQKWPLTQQWEKREEIQKPSWRRCLCTESLNMSGKASSFSPSSQHPLSPSWGGWPLLLFCVERSSCVGVGFCISSCDHTISRLCSVDVMECAH